MSCRFVIPIQIKRKAGELYRNETAKKTSAVFGGDILAFYPVDALHLNDILLTGSRLHSPKTEISVFVDKAVIKSPVFPVHLSASGEGYTGEKKCDNQKKR